jgi:SAM-dependent methyltransferase
VRRQNQSGAALLERRARRGARVNEPGPAGAHTRPHGEVAADRGVDAGKRYDAGYFARWYHGPDALVRPELIRRKARLALAAAEHMLGREVQTVLDAGCGEAPWRAVLRRARPGLRYQGVDASEWVVRRWGRRRGIRHGTLGTLDRLGFREPFDLVVCSDMLQYLPDAELRAGLRNLHVLTGGLAFIEAFADEDDMVGDADGWVHRPAASYRRELRRAGFTACGLHCYLPRSMRAAANALELAGPGA